MSVLDITRSAIEQHVQQIDTSTVGCPLTVYILRDSFTRTQLLEVLAEVRVRHPGVLVNACGREVAAFSYPTKWT
jgi:hypothetical protein